MVQFLNEFRKLNNSVHDLFIFKILLTVEKGEIARYEQFLLFLQCFLKTCNADT